MMTVRSVFAASVSFLGSPPVKESIKNVAGIVTFAFGFYEIYTDLAHRQFDVDSVACKEGNKHTIASWNIAKIILLITKISLIASGVASRPGILICSAIGGKLFSEQTLRSFGPNTIFAINPSHPRHLISIVAAILSIPGALATVYEAGIWLKQKVTLQPQKSLDPVYPMATFNLILSRPFIHIAHAFSRSLIRH